MSSVARSLRTPGTLLAALAPGACFLVLLLAAADGDPRFAWVAHPSSAPWPILVLAVAGIVGAGGAVGDFCFHRMHGRPLVGRPEHVSHVLALVTGGLPLFAVMACATLAQRRGPFLVPALALAAYVVVFVAYDAFVFHRRRRTGALERTFHGATTTGNGLAFLAWAHWLWGGA
jgi:hypothetical protein